ncbi:Uncharacterised protein [Mycobacteroides abscessus]|uniref:Uncharacterized protein n=1 Tax=Mycobacteroides abscessus subsp. massiliense TaxID=1962118 RepID=A0AB38DLL0_9MYCO|nr:hypothetical protein [Mycobacteroides abscessus]AMU24447.1 hypothetical protein A3N96_02590 [Mycobacteroides abscessus]AMU34177.1 hypothetical protein A3N98_02055 [Mycobacteroides abscessus]AMU39119.1 hypothetical protein A3N99_02055 [Mycobacteroides abscessus]AMU59169.1 hypothetical protein A3O03_02590 [Mycobacteroides abscessus]MBN7343984.1 hypothetical protein [Mycobacteroides abscessus subsp. massiliense]
MTTAITTATPGSYTARALSTIPGHAEQVAQVERLKEWHLRNSHAAETVCNTSQFEAAMAAEIGEAARAGQQSAPELTERAREHLAARDAHQQIVAAHRHAVAVAETQLAAIERDGVSHAYQWLREQLDELFAAFGELDIEPSLTAERALREGRGAAYTSAADLANDYLGLRNAHRQIVRLDAASGGHETGALSHRVAVCGQMREFIDAEPFWALRRRMNARQATDVTETGNAHKQWLAAAPDPVGRRLGGSPKAPVPEGITQIAWLAHVAAHRPWLPDAATLIDAYDLAVAACRPGRPAVIDYSRCWWILPSTKTFSDQQITARDALAELANSTEQSAPTTV